MLEEELSWQKKQRKLEGKHSKLQREEERVLFTVDREL